MQRGEPSVPGKGMHTALKQASTQGSALTRRMECSVHTGTPNQSHVSPFRLAHPGSVQRQ